MKSPQAVILGDSTHNTLSAVRSLGEAKMPFSLMMKCDEDVCNVGKSKFLKKGNLITVKEMDECLPLLERMKLNGITTYLMCTFDEAAEWVDRHEEELSKKLVTPCRGGHIGKLFEKDVQCKLAAECGLTVPRSEVYHRGEDFESISIHYPLLLKPLQSTQGEKEDIHICRSREDVNKALRDESHCPAFMVQEFIEKEYELDCVGMRSDEGLYLVGAIRKIRHWPPMIGAGAYGIFIPIEETNVNVKGVEKFLERAGYFGPFSVEFLHCGDKNYFMEVNFRNEGLAYAATVAGANLHAKYINPDFKLGRIRHTYMMNYSLDYLYVKTGQVSKLQWWHDFLRTRCFINFNWHDPMPTLAYYKKKIFGKLKFK